jgi:transcription antitermination factor NusG
MSREVDNYYCIALPRAGVESRLAKRLNKTFEKADAESVGFLALCPEKEVMLQHHGKWEKVTKPMTPGYVMVRSTANPLFVQNLLYDAGNGGRLLRYGNDGDYALYGRDLHYAQWVFSYDGLIGLSKVKFVPGNPVQVISGPLASMQGLVTKVEKKGRKAWVDLSMMGQIIRVSIGVEFLMSGEEIESPPSCSK